MKLSLLAFIAIVLALLFAQAFANSGPLETMDKSPPELDAITNLISADYNIPGPAAYFPTASGNQYLDHENIAGPGVFVILNIYSANQPVANIASQSDESENYYKENLNSGAGLRVALTAFHFCLFNKTNENYVAVNDHKNIYDFPANYLIDNKLYKIAKETSQVIFRQWNLPLLCYTPNININN